MAADVVLGPAPLHRLSVSSSSQPSTASSESPQHTPGTPGTISFNFRYPSSERTHEVIPKIEEVDENDNNLGDVSPVLPTESLPSPSHAVVKRPRGRPRKHPIPSPTAVSKPSKGRSKTGCITCRKRKKKCDERRPTCLHCEKNNVHCEGYPPKEFWRPGKNKSEGRRNSFVVSRELPPLINGVETDTDRHFLDHFNFNISRVLSLFTDEQNPFKELLLPMAIRHRGLMHSLLCLAGSHLTARQDPPNELYVNRRFYHFQQAIQNLRTDRQFAAVASGDASQPIDDPVVAQTIVLCLNSIVNGEVKGEYRPHLDAAKHLIQTQCSPNQDFQNFLVEFFIYHDVSNSITSIDRRSVLMMEDFKLPDFMIQPEAGALLGVVDGLFGYISKIRQIRDRIRERRTQRLKPLVDYSILSDAGAIDTGLRSWECAQPENTARYVASCLYQQTTYIYLHRTIMPSQATANLRTAVDKGLEFLRQLPEDSSTQSILLMPVFLLGCAAFEPSQRPEIIKAFDALQAYSNLGNIKYARIIVEKVWEMMDNGDEDSWDWETIILRQGWDFLVT